MEVIGTRNNGRVLEYEDNSMYDTENSMWIKSAEGLDNDHYIYRISDINGSCYIGETSLSLDLRKELHMREKGNCAAKELDLEKSEIELLEICLKRDKEECEFKWIQIYEDCINYNKTPPIDFEKRQDKRTYQHFYNLKHGMVRNEEQKQRRQQIDIDNEMPQTY
tara:strand:- start:786 stop:1280 length:495 start_codon:yes stop_codon:yes gene_type:complete